MDNTGNSKLTEHLQQLLNHYNQLLSMLEQEKDILERSDSDALLTITEQKQSQLTLITNNEQAFDKLFSTTQGSLYDKIADRLKTSTQKNADEANNVWEKLQNTVLACKRQNTINGGAVYANLELTRRGLQILTHSKTETTTYDEKGNIK